MNGHPNTVSLQPLEGPYERRTPTKSGYLFPMGKMGITLRVSMSWTEIIDSDTDPEIVLQESCNVQYVLDPFSTISPDTDGPVWTRNSLKESFMTIPHPTSKLLKHGIW